MSKGGAAEPPKAEASANIHWFTVRYGADQTQLFNLDCWGQARFHPLRTAATAWRTGRALTAARSQVLLDHIKSRCGFGAIPEEVDLQPEDGTGLVGLPKVGRSPAAGVLKPKATYNLCKLVVPAEGGAPTVERL